MRAMSHSAARCLGLTGNSHIEARLDREPSSYHHRPASHPLFFRQGQSNKDIVIASVVARGRRGRTVLYAS